jgi:hypothetical protein
LTYSDAGHAPKNFKAVKIIDFAAPIWANCAHPFPENASDLLEYLQRSVITKKLKFDLALLAEAWTTVQGKLMNLPEPVVRFYVYPPVPGSPSLLDLFAVDFCPTSGGLSLPKFMLELERKLYRLCFERFPEGHVFVGRPFADLVGFTDAFNMNSDVQVLEAEVREWVDKRCDSKSLDPKSFAPFETLCFERGSRPLVSGQQAFQQLIWLRFWVEKRFDALSRMLPSILPKKDEVEKKETNWHLICLGEDRS